MQIDYSSAGIRLTDLDLWLDPQGSQGAAWLSHGHSDHARGFSRVVIGTPATLRVYRIRWPEQSHTPQTLIPLDYGQSMDWGGARLTAYPAGHILGAAQLLVEYAGERLVYTGDLKLRAPLCGRPTEMPPCDRLIIESTFGLPIYHFLSREEAAQRIVQFAQECLADKATPAFWGYPLGRGQEIAHVLCQAGLPVALHGAMAKFLPLYEEYGYSFPGWQNYEARDIADKALVVVPGMRRLLEASGKDVRVAYVSGWAALDNARTRAGAEMLIPYSDHADFEELLELVERSGARQVDVIHGYTEVFAQILRDRGIDARAPQAVAARASEEEGGAAE
jgi:Cft2 family RNA processing exonuclease